MRCRRHLFLSQSVPRRRTFWALPTSSTKNNCTNCYCSRHVCTLLHHCHFLPPFPFSHQSVFFRGEKWNRGPSWGRKTILSIRSRHIWTQQQPLLILQASTTPDDSDDSLDSFLQGRRSSLSVVEESSLRRTISFWCLASCYSSMAYLGATWRQVSVKGSWLDAWTPCAPLIQCYSISSGSMRRQKLLSDSFRFVLCCFVLCYTTWPYPARPYPARPYLAWPLLLWNPRLGFSWAAVSRLLSLMLGGLLSHPSNGWSNSNDSDESDATSDGAFLHFWGLETGSGPKLVGLAWHLAVLHFSR